MLGMLKFEKKEVYGRELLFPTCEQGKALCALARQKSLQRKSIHHVLNLGFKVVLIGEETELLDRRV